MAVCGVASQDLTNSGVGAGRSGEGLSLIFGVGVVAVCDEMEWFCCLPVSVGW